MGFNTAIVAFTGLRYDCQFYFPLLDVKDCIAGVALRVYPALLSNAHIFLALADIGKECLNVGIIQLFFEGGIAIFYVSCYRADTPTSRSALSNLSVLAKKCFRAGEQLLQAVRVRLRNDRRDARRASFFLQNP